MKISIIGTGFVGSTIAYTLILNKLADEIVLVDINTEKAYGESLDLNHGISLTEYTKIYPGNYEDTYNSDIIILCAGLNRKPGESRLDLVNKNTEILKSIIPEIMKYSINPIFLVVSNPVDILTYVTYKLSGLPENKVIGTGTLLDTSRLKYFISKELNISTDNIDAIVIGEHGDSMVPLFSYTKINKKVLEDVCNERQIDFTKLKEDTINELKEAGQSVIKRKQATYYAIALSVKTIIENLIQENEQVLPVSTLINNRYGISDVCLSLPTVLGLTGIKDIVDTNLSHKEMNLLIKSADSLKTIISHLNI